MNYQEPPFTEEQLVSAGFDRKKTIELMQEELNFFAGMVIPMVFVHMFPDIHQQIWKLLREMVEQPRTFYKLALGLPRGHAKTTLIKLFVCYCVLFTDKTFVLLVGSASRLAEGSLSDITAMLRSENVKSIFGTIIFQKDTEAVKRFAFAGRNIILAAIGAGSSVRGLNLDNDRPDVIICDDIQSAEDKDNKEVADKLLVWMLGTLFLAKSPLGCLYIYIGNMFSGPNCILAKLKNDSGWISFIVGALLSDGTSIWPELHSPEQLISELKDATNLGHPEIWFAEVQNDPDSGVSSRFDVSKVPAYPFTPQDIITAGAIIIDLSGQKVGSDDATIGYFCDIDHRGVYRGLAVGKWSPLECIEAAMRMAFKWNCPYIFVESVAYQASYKFWFNFICTQREITGFQLYELYPGQTAKNTRILGFLKQVLAGDILIHPDIRVQVLYQASQFKPSTKNNEDDILDLGGYKDIVWSNYEPMLQTAVNEVLENMKNGDKTIEDCCVA